MNKKLLWGGLLLFIIGGAAAIYFLVLKKSQEHFKLIPKDAFVVVTADLKSLADKANSKEWKDLYMVKKMDESKHKDDENSKFVKDVMSNPLAMGIDPVSDIYMFVQMGGSMKPMVGVAFAVRNKDDLEKILMKIPEKNLDIKKEVVAKDGYKLFKLDNDALIAWRDGAGIFLSGENSEVLVAAADKIMKLDAKSSLADNNHFKDFANNKHDIGFFLNYEAIMNNPEISSGIKMSGGSSYIDALKSATMAMNLNFEKDKIALTSEYKNANKDAEEKYNFFSTNKVSAATLKTLTDKNPYAYLGIAIDIKKIFSFIENDPLIGKGLNEVAQNFGLSKEELKNIFGGEIALTLNDFSMQTTTRTRYNWDETGSDYKEEEYADTSMMPEFSVAVSIKDRAALQKLIARTQIPKDALGYYMIKEAGMNMYLVETNSGVTFTNGSSVATTLAAKKELASAVGGKAGEVAAKSATSFYFNLNLNEYPQVLRNMMQKEMKNEEYKLFSDFMAMFKYTEAYGNAKTGEMNVMMTESNDNSLWRIIKQIDGIAKVEGEKSKKREAEYEKIKQENIMTDSVAAMVTDAAETKNQ